MTPTDFTPHCSKSRLNFQPERRSGGGGSGAISVWPLLGRCGLIVLVLITGGCRDSKTPAAKGPPGGQSQTGGRKGDGSGGIDGKRSQQNRLETVARFRDVAAEAGVVFAYRDGQEAGNFAILESLGGGVALVDFDLDGRNDLYFPGGGGFEPGAVPVGLAGALFRNVDTWRFADVTQHSGLGQARHYTHGAATADYDSDGFPDLLLTGYGGLTLYRNLGDGTFADVTESAGLVDRLWSSSAGWGDLDGDGTLDLYVAHYVDWSPENHPFCNGPNPDNPREVCSPRQFQGLPDSLFLGTSEGTFRDATRESGLRQAGDDDKVNDKSLGVVMADIDLDGDLDIYVGNDTVPNFLYINDGTGKLTEVALKSGSALSDRGTPDGSMGVDIVDFNLDGRPDIWVANYERESIALYRQEQSGRQSGEVFFTHVSQMAGITNVGGLFVGWGTAFFDLDRDGDEDALVSNGHVIRFPTNSEVPQLPLLLENLAGRRFQNVASLAGEYLVSRHRGRGVAVGDLDGDGRIDAAISKINDPVSVLANESPETNHWLGLRLIGRASNRDGIGAFVRLRTPRGEQLRLVKGGGSYASTNDRLVHFGLGETDQIDSIEIHWPAGHVQTLTGITPDGVQAVIEPVAGGG